jgi:hypothetical protein
MVSERCEPRVTAALSAVEQRLQLLPAPPGSEAMVPMEPFARDDCTTLC